MRRLHRLYENCLDPIDSMVTLRRVVNAVRLLNDISFFFIINHFIFFPFLFCYFVYAHFTYKTAEVNDAHRQTTITLIK